MGSNREIENGECIDVIIRAIGGSKRVMWPHPMSCHGSFQVRKDVWSYLVRLWLEKIDSGYMKVWIASSSSSSNWSRIIGNYSSTNMISRCNNDSHIHSKVILGLLPYKSRYLVRNFGYEHHSTLPAVAGLHGLSSVTSVL